MAYIFIILLLCLGEYAQTWDERDNIVVQEDGIVIFGNDFALRRLGECRTVYGDGSFRYKPFSHS